MATRFVYKAIEEAPFVRKVPVEFEWFGGFSLVQKRRCIASLHRAYAAGSPGDRVLEISSKSPDGLGVALSAFNLSLELGGRVVPVECAFQGSKVFEEGGPYTDLLEASPRDAKRDARLLESGRLVAFELAGERYPLEPKDAFYNFVWIRALRQHGTSLRLFRHTTHSRTSSSTRSGPSTARRLPPRCTWASSGRTGCRRRSEASAAS